MPVIPSSLVMFFTQKDRSTASREKVVVRFQIENPSIGTLKVGEVLTALVVSDW